MRQLALRPADVAVALELALRPGQGLVPLATAVGISLGEAHNAVSRLRRARLLRPDERRVVASALADFLVHGVPYAFPGELGAQVGGVPTAHAGPPLAKVFRGDPVVWPSVDGTVRGDSLVPLYPAAPRLAGRVPDLYELLTLVDAIRVGRARERTRAAALLRERLGLS
jgi:hypothetical protein